MQGRNQVLKLGVAQMDGKIWKEGGGGGICYQMDLSYTGLTIQLHCSFMVPCCKAK